MKKIISMTLALMVLTGQLCVVQASEILTVDDTIAIDYEKYAVSFGGETNNTHQSVGVQLTDSDGNYAAFMQVSPDQDGRYQCSFAIDEYFTGKDLTLMVSQIGNASVSRTIYVTGQADVKAWLAEYKNKHTAAELEAHTEIYLETILKNELDLTQYQVYKDRLFDILKNFKEDYITVEQLSKQINQSIAVVKVNEADADTLKVLFEDEANKALLSIDFDVLDSAFETFVSYRNDKSLVEIVEMTGTGFDTPAEVVTALKQASALAEINAAKSDAMEAVLTKYQEQFATVSSTFHELMEDYTVASGRALVHKNFTTLKDIVETLENAIALLAAEEDKLSDSGNGGGSSGGGSSGGSRGGGSSGGSNHTSTYSGITNIPQPEIAPLKSASFTDMAGYQWAEEAVNTLVEKNIISGRSQTEFSPADYITREEFVKMAVLLFDIYNESAEAEFADVEKEDWFYAYVASAVEKSMVSGLGGGYFGTGENVTRQDIVTILGRALETKGVELSGDDVNIADIGDTSAYARNYVERFYASKIVQGNGEGYFEPLKSATRAEGAVIIFNVLNILNEE